MCVNNCDVLINRIFENSKEINEMIFCESHSKVIYSLHICKDMVLVCYRNYRYPGCTTRTSVPSQPTALQKPPYKKNRIYKIKTHHHTTPPPQTNPHNTTQTDPTPPPKPKPKPNPTQRKKKISVSKGD